MKIINLKTNKRFESMDDGNIVILGNTLNKNNPYLNIEYLYEDSIEFLGFEIIDDLKKFTLTSVFERCEELKKELDYKDFKIAFVELRKHSAYYFTDCDKNIDELLKIEQIGEEEIDEDEYPSLAIIYDSRLFTEKDIFNKIEDYYNGYARLVRYYPSLDADDVDFEDMIVFSSDLHDIMQEVKEYFNKTSDEVILFNNYNEFELAKTLIK